MRARGAIITVTVGVVAAAWAFAAEANDAEDNAGKDGGYVESEEKVVNLVTGKVETQRVIEFPELRIFPDLARPVSIIIPRQKPDFEHIPFTIYNNEPPSYVPEQYRREYYRRVPPARDLSGNAAAAEMFRPSRGAVGRRGAAEDNASDKGADDGD